MSENAVPENVVPLVEKIVSEGPAAAAELEKKRHIAMRAFQISAKQLEHDALEIEKTAIVGDHPIERRHELMRTAEALRVAGQWLINLATPPETSNAG